MGVKCVKCGSNNTAEYLYGLPLFNEKLQQDMADNKVILGGCEVSDFDPKYHCNECDNDFGFSAKRLCDGEFTDYIEETVYYMFSIDYPQFGESKFTLSKENDKFYVRVYTPKHKYEKEIPEKEYKKNLTTIFEKAYVLEWNEEYVILPKVDGTKWKVEVKCNNGKTFSSIGKNCFAPYFKKAKSRYDYYSINFERN